MLFFKLRTGKISRLLFLALLFLLFAQTNQVLADIEVSGSITTDTVWGDTSQPYVVTGTLYIRNNATLTIKPGVELQFKPNCSLYIGNDYTTGTMIAEGTTDEPITFTGSSDAPWYTIYFGAYTGEGSILSHCIIENGGNSGLGLVRIQTDNLTIKQCTFRNSASYPIYLVSTEALSAIDSASTYTDNNDNRIYVSPTSFIRDATIVKAGTPYLFSGTHYISNHATLTVKPGVELQFKPNCSLYIGNDYTTGTMIAEGTTDEPITFTGSSDAPWYTIYFGAYTGEGSILSHCIIENGGTYSNNGMLGVATKNLTIEHCTLKNSKYSGLYLSSNGIPTLSENHYENNGAYPIYVVTAESLSAIDSASTYTNNKDNRIYVASDSFTSNTTMADAGIPYLFSGTHYISNHATLTVKPGVELQFKPNCSLYIGNDYTTGTLIAEGTTDEPITFTGSSDAPWYTIYFGAYTGAGSILSHCIIENGGNSGFGLVRIQTDNLTIKQCTFRNSASYPIYLVSTEALSAIDSASTYTDNNDNRIYVSPTSFISDATIVKAGTPYLFSGTHYISNHATLTVKPGVELQFKPNCSLYIGNDYKTGTLIAEGTADAPITFTSAQAAPQAGDWGGIYLYQYDGGSSLLNAVIEYGTNNINIASSSPVIEKCTIRYGSTSGIYIPTAVTPSIFCSTITANGIGISLTGNADPYLHDNDIYGNTTYGLSSYNYNTTVTAEDNWWGAAGGPGSEGADSVYNRYSQTLVDYDPWLTASASCTVPLKASFSATPASGSEDLTVTFTDGSTGAAGTWKWDFDDGTTSEEQNPVHTYGEPGEYTVSLTVWEVIEGQAAEASDTTTRKITVTESVPTASFTPNAQVSGIPPLTVNFGDQSTASGSEGIVSRAWDFNGDGTADSTDANPSWTFYDPGYHSVSLTVTDEDGDQDTMARDNLIYVSDADPVAVPGGPYSGTEGHSILFDASGSYDPNQGGIAEYKWDFDNDGTIDRTTSSPTTSYAYSQDSEEQNNGVYTATLTVTDQAGSTGSNSTTVTVADTEPEIDFDADVTSGTAPLTITFNDSSSSYDGIESYTWNFGDYNIGTGQNTEHTFTHAGTYTVTLTVIEADGDQKQLGKTGYITVQACTTYYLDADNDGYGTDDSQCLATPTGSYRATQSGDCNDQDSTVNPGAQEVCSDGVDNNCNGKIDEGCGSVDGDLDSDGDVDTADRTIFISSLRKCTGAVGFNPDADYDNDGCVTFRDYSYWMAYYRAYLSGD